MVTAAAASAAAARSVAVTTVSAAASAVVAISVELSRRFNTLHSPNTHGRRGSGCVDDGESEEKGGDELHFVYLLIVDEV